MTTKEFDQLLDNIQSIILSFLVKLGPFFVALMPALFTGYAVYHTFKPDAGVWVAGFFAVVICLAIETVGIVAVHTTMDLYNGMEAGNVHPVKFWVMFLMVPFYVLSIMFAVGFAGDVFPKLVKVLGITGPILTVIVYTAVVLNQDSERIKREVAGKRSEARETRQATKKDSLERFRITEGSRVKIAVAKMQYAEPVAQVAKPSATIPPTLPEWCEVAPESREHFRQLVAKGHIRLPGKITGAELARQVPSVGSTRSGQNWLGDVRGNGNAK